MNDDYYKILGISPKANQEKIKKAYRKIAKESHPDTSAANINGQRFRRAREAYETLGDEHKRKKYDEELEKRKCLKTSNNDFAAVGDRKSDPVFFRNPGVFDSFFNDIFRGPVTADSEDIACEVILSPKEAMIGGEYSFTLVIEKRCGRCCGNTGYGDIHCPECNGRGVIVTPKELILSIPPNIEDGVRKRISLAHVGFPRIILNLVVTIDDGF